MRRLSFLIWFILLFNFNFGQSPHGKRLKIECDVCHSGDGWYVDLTKMKFDHNKTNFKLSGQHQSIDCRKCHTSLVFSKGDMECRNCHTDMHNGTVGYDCSRCHNTNSWIVTNITGMHQQTRFPLLGVHAVADCYSCHKSGSLLQFEPLGVDCYDCHKDKYLATTSPNHQTSGYSTNCLECHTMTAPDWFSASINHSFFPLTGGHAISCTQCHVTGTFGKLPTDCNSCHAVNYNATTNPPHVASQFPITCETCHTINAWSPATFDHNTTTFPLTGAHINVVCTKCHTTGYVGTPTACNACHMADYNGTTNPAHATAQFPTDCQPCHNTTAWSPSTFNHDTAYFPIYTGRHAGTWTLCSQCHPTASNFASFTCLTCHAHDQAPMNNAHSGVSGYSYTSSACYSCHPRGSGGG
jgi:hypothetical protein